MDITERLERIGRGEHMDLADIVCADAIKEIMRLRAGGYTAGKESLRAELEWHRAEVERLRAVLQEIAKQADSDSGLAAWDCGDMARAALKGSPNNKDGKP